MICVKTVHDLQIMGMRDVDAVDGLAIFSREMMRCCRGGGEEVCPSAIATMIQTQNGPDGGIVDISRG